MSIFTYCRCVSRPKIVMNWTGDLHNYAWRQHINYSWFALQIDPLVEPLWHFIGNFTGLLLAEDFGWDEVEETVTVINWHLLQEERAMRVIKKEDD